MLQLHGESMFPNRLIVDDSARQPDPPRAQAVPLSFVKTWLRVRSPSLPIVLQQTREAMLESSQVLTAVCLASFKSQQISLDIRWLLTMVLCVYLGSLVGLGGLRETSA